MAMQQIPQDQWASLFDSLSRQYQSGQVSVEVRGDGLPQQEAVRAQPFLGITYELKGSEAGRIDVMFGSDVTNSVSHAITSPTAVLAEENTPPEQVQMIQIDTAEGDPTTIVHFLSAS